MVGAMETRIVILPYKAVDDVSAPDLILVPNTTKAELEAMVECYGGFPSGLSIYVGSRTNPVFQQLKTLLAIECFFCENENYSVWTDEDEEARPVLERVQAEYALLQRAHTNIIEAYKAHINDMRQQYAQLLTVHREMLQKYTALLGEKVGC